MKKYELIEETGEFTGGTLHRIKYLIDIPRYMIKKGDLGGWLESEKNLSHDGDCCVLDDGTVVEHGLVTGNGCVSGNGWVGGYGKVFGAGTVSDYGLVVDHGRVSGKGSISGYGNVSGNGWVSGNGRVCSLDDIAIISGFSPENTSITFYRTKDNGVGVTCGYCIMTLNDFRGYLKETQEDSDIVKEYLTITDLMESRFKRLGEHLMFN